MVELELRPGYYDPNFSFESDQRVYFWSTDGTVNSLPSLFPSETLPSRTGILADTVTTGESSIKISTN